MLFLVGFNAPADDLRVINLMTESVCQP